MLCKSNEYGSTLRLFNVLFDLSLNAAPPRNAALAVVYYYCLSWQLVGFDGLSQRVNSDGAGVATCTKACQR